MNFRRPRYRFNPLTSAPDAGAQAVIRRWGLAGLIVCALAASVMRVTKNISVRLLTQQK